MHYRQCLALAQQRVQIMDCAILTAKLANVIRAVQAPIALEGPVCKAAATMAHVIRALGIAIAMTDGRIRIHLIQRRHAHQRFAAVTRRCAMARASTPRVIVATMVVHVRQAHNAVGMVVATIVIRGAAIAHQAHPIAATRHAVTGTPPQDCAVLMISHVRNGPFATVRFSMGPKPQPLFPTQSSLFEVGRQPYCIHS